MNKELIMDAMEYIDDELLEDVNTLRSGSPLKRSRIWMRYASAAACVCIVLGGMLFVSRFYNMKSYPESDGADNEMMAEATDYTEWKTGKRNEGMSFSMKIVTQKMSGTLSQSVSSVLLSAIGYKTSNSSVRLSQQNKVQKGIFNIFSLPIAISYILAALPFFFYKLDKTTHERMLSDLAERRETNNNQS